MFSSRLCIGFDIDEDALRICQRNLAELEIGQVELVNGDINQLENSEDFRRRFDTVIMNPPFGTKHNKGQ